MTPCRGIREAAGGLRSGTSSLRLPGPALPRPPRQVGMLTPTASTPRLVCPSLACRQAMRQHPKRSAGYP